MTPEQEVERDEWRSFGDCEPEEGQWIELRGFWDYRYRFSSQGGAAWVYSQGGDSPRPITKQREWRPASPPEQEQRDEHREEA